MLDGRRRLLLNNSCCSLTPGENGCNAARMAGFGPLLDSFVALLLLLLLLLTLGEALTGAAFAW
jgi:hypothetical protein